MTSMTSHVSGMTYARFFPSDWRTGCLILNLEEEGLYIRFCAYMYDTGSAPPDNDQITSRLLNVQVQKYKKVMAALIAKGKIIRAQGLLINERVQAELDRYRSEHVARIEAAKKREAERKSRMQREIADVLKAKAAAEAPLGQPPHQPPDQPMGGSLGGTPDQPQGVPRGVAPPNPLKSLNAGSTAVAQGDHGSGTNLESRSQKLEQERKNTTTSVESDAARSGGDYIDILNGTAVDLLAFIGKHAGGIIEPAEAKRMLSANIKAFGPDAMMEAYSATIAEMAGGMIAKPYKYLIETAGRIKARRATRVAKAAADSPEARREKREKAANDAAAKIDAENSRRRWA